MNPPEDPSVTAADAAAAGGVKVPILVEISDSKKIKIPFKTNATVAQLAEEARRRATAMGCAIPASAQLACVSDGALLWGEDILADVIDLPTPVLRFLVPADDDMHIDIEPEKPVPVLPTGGGGAAGIAGAGMEGHPSFGTVFGGVVLSEDGLTATCDKSAAAGAALISMAGEAGKAYYCEVETLCWPDDGGKKVPSEGDAPRNFGRLAWVHDDKDVLTPGCSVSSFGFNNCVTAFHDGIDITYGASGVSYCRDDDTVAVVGCALDARAQSARVGWTVGGIAVGSLSFGPVLPPHLLAALPLKPVLTLKPGYSVRLLRACEVTEASDIDSLFAQGKKIHIPATLPPLPHP